MEMLEPILPPESLDVVEPVTFLSITDQHDHDVASARSELPEPNHFSNVRSNGRP